jgi:hypothetical protein
VATQRSRFAGSLRVSQGDKWLESSERSAEVTIAARWEHPKCRRIQGFGNVPFFSSFEEPSVRYSKPAAGGPG